MPLLLVTVAMAVVDDDNSQGRTRRSRRDLYLASLYALRGVFLVSLMT